jgi:hypothetical protein
MACIVQVPVKAKPVMCVADEGTLSRDGGSRERKKTVCGSSNLLSTDRTHLSFSRC